jgi:osmotically-inducible protein OsmY
MGKELHRYSQEGKMTILTRIVMVVIAALALGMAGCSSESTKSPDVADSIHKALDQAGLKDVSVKQDRDKGVVTLGGHVAVDADKARADSIAKSIAGSQVVANEVIVTPPGAESTAKTVNSDLDKGIDKDVDAALVQNRLKKGITYDVKNGVVTLKGDVNSDARRSQVESVTASVPNVRQVVNEIQVKNRKATASN